jgi:hypothetical protein
MNLFHNSQELKNNALARKIKNGVSEKSNAFDLLRLKMINELKN